MIVDPEEEKPKAGGRSGRRAGSKDRTPRNTENYKGNKNAETDGPGRLVVSLSVNAVRQDLLEKRLVKEGTAVTSDNIKDLARKIALDAIDSLD